MIISLTIPYIIWPRTKYEIKQDRESTRIELEKEREEKERIKREREMIRPSQVTMAKCEKLYNLLDNYYGTRMMLDGRISYCKAQMYLYQYSDGPKAEFYYNNLVEILLTDYVDVLMELPEGKNWVLAHKL